MSKSLAQLLDEIGNLKRESSSLYQLYKGLREEEDLLKSELLFKLKDTGLKSAKGDGFTASIAELPTIVIEHEQSVLEWLRRNPEVEEDAYIGLKETAFKQYAQGLLKKTGELADGTNYIVKESLSIRKNKEK